LNCVGGGELKKRNKKDIVETTKERLLNLVPSG
jgi:hypothetical protein